MFGSEKLQPCTRSASFITPERDRSIRAIWKVRGFFSEGGGNRCGIFLFCQLVPANWAHHGPWARGPRALGPCALGPRALGPRPQAHGPWPIVPRPTGPGPMGPWAQGQRALGQWDQTQGLRALMGRQRFTKSFPAHRRPGAKISRSGKPLTWTRYATSTGRFGLCNISATQGRGSRFFKVCGRPF